TAMLINRRDLLLAGAATTLSGAFLESFGGAAAASDSKTPNGFKKAVKINMVKAGEKLLDKFQLLKELSFDGIELDSPSGVTVEEARRCIAETGVAVPGVVDSVHWQQRLSDPSEEVRAKGLAA